MQQSIVIEKENTKKIAHFLGRLKELSYLCRTKDKKMAQNGNFFNGYYFYFYFGKLK